MDNHIVPLGNFGLKEFLRDLQEEYFVLLFSAKEKGEEVVVNFHVDGDGRIRYSLSLVFGGEILVEALAEELKRLADQGTPALLAEIERLNREMEFTQTAERMPENGMLVLADIGQEYPIRAFWVEKFGTEVVDDYEGTSDYNEANDTFYWPEGWYENNLHEATHWLVEVPVLRWRALESFHKK